MADCSPCLSSETYSSAELGSEDNIEDVNYEQSNLEVHKHNCHRYTLLTYTNTCRVQNLLVEIVRILFVNRYHRLLQR